jgi:FMN phosphatase YigB (HAD superfamily)
LFEKTYYSHEIGLRKPHAEVYEFVLQDAGLVATETLFIDDTPPNLTAPAQLGIRTRLLDMPVTDILNGFLREIQHKVRTPMVANADELVSLFFVASLGKIIKHAILQMKGLLDFKEIRY